MDITITIPLTVEGLKATAAGCLRTARGIELEAEERADSDETDDCLASDAEDDAYVASVVEAYKTMKPPPRGYLADHFIPAVVDDCLASDAATNTGIPGLVVHDLGPDETPIPFRVATDAEPDIPLPPADTLDTDEAAARTPPLAPSNLDLAGVAYDPEIHAKNRAKKADGTWKARRGMAKAAIPAPPAGPTVAHLLGKLIAADVDHEDIDAAVSLALGVREAGMKLALTGGDPEATEKAATTLTALCVENGVTL